MIKKGINHCTKQYTLKFIIKITCDAFALLFSLIKFNITLNIFHRLTTNSNKFGRLLKITFVLILIFTGVVLEVLNILDFSRSKEAKRLHTRVVSLIKLVVYIETLCKYF